jgi:hypothetical protein
MARPEDFDPELVYTYVEQQLLQCQINYMDYHRQGDILLASNEAAVMDKLHEFLFLFFDVQPPAPGQGYEPPPSVWTEIERDRQLELIDTAVAELLARREAILGGASDEG